MNRAEPQKKVKAIHQEMASLRPLLLNSQKFSQRHQWNFGLPDSCATSWCCSLPFLKRITTELMLGRYCKQMGQATLACSCSVCLLPIHLLSSQRPHSVY